MYYSELTLLTILVVVLLMRPKFVGGFVKSNLGKFIMLLSIVLIATYNNKMTALIAALLCISLIHITHNNTLIEGMDNTDISIDTDNKDMSVSESKTTNDNKEKDEKKDDEKLSKMDLECISRALRSCSANELPVNRDNEGKPDEAPQGTISATGKGTEEFYS